MAFLPTDLANLWGWWKGDAGVTGDPSVISWADQSGNSRTMTIPGILGSPTKDNAAINSLPAIVTLLGSQALQTTANIGPISTATVFLVAKQLAGESAFGAFLNAGNNLSLNRYNTANKIVGDSATGSIAAGAQINATDDTWYTIRLRVSATDVYISLNNGTEVTVARDATTIAGLTAGPLSLFTDTGSHNGKKAIAEVVVYTSNLTGNDSLEVEYYLQQKYNHFTWSGSIPSSENTSTMATNQVIADVLGLWYSTVLDTPVWIEIVCGDAFSIAGSTDVNTKKTFCGVIKTVSPPDFTISGSGVANTAPDAGTQGSANEIMGLFQAQTPVKLKIAYRTGTSLIYRTTNGTAYLSSYNETYNVGEAVAFDFEFSVSEDFDLTP